MLHNPFPYKFYFKQGSILEGQFREAEALREKQAFGKDFGRRVWREKTEAPEEAAHEERGGRKPSEECIEGARRVEIPKRSR